MVVEDMDEPRGPALLRAPATSVLAICWVAVFLLMAVARGGPIRIPTLLYGGFIGTNISHGFGDITPIGLYGGQFWRAVTATFVHFNLIHLLLNLVAFIQLGRVVESWYGSWQFLSIYVVLGAGANLLSNLLRPWMDGASGLIVHSGGGSTVVLGLVGLVAVVGWRNPSEFPKRAPIWMLAILLVNGFLGVVVPNIDNLGHASGAVVGALVGLFDRRLIGLSKSWRARLAGLLSLAVLIGSASVQVDQRRLEVAASDRFVLWATVVQRLSQIDLLYHQLAARGRSPAARIEPKPPNVMGLPVLVIPEHPAVLGALRVGLLGSIRQLDALPHGFAQSPSAEAYRDVRVLGARAVFKPPIPGETARFEEQLPRISRPAWASWASARRELERMQRPEPRFAREAISRLVRRSGPPRAGAGASPTSPSGPPRTPTSSGSAKGTP